MSFSLIDICHGCGLTIDDWVRSGIVALVFGVILGLLRCWIGAEVAIGVERLSFSLCDDCGTWASSLESTVSIALFVGAAYLIARLLLELRDRIRE